MARIRFVKPEFFSDARLVRLKPITRLFYIGLFTQADREGRFTWNEDDLKVKLIPYDRVQASDCLEQLRAVSRIVRYGSAGQYGQIINFLKHQYINPREPDSKLPKYEGGTIPVSYQSDTGILDKGIRNKDKGERELKNSLSYLEKIPDQDKKYFTDRFEMSQRQLLSKAESFFLYCTSKNRKYADYRAALLNAIKDDFTERPIKKADIRKPQIPEKQEPERERKSIPKDIKDSINKILNNSKTNG